VRYLDPIGPHEAQSRDEMLRLVRRRMLSKYMYMCIYIFIYVYVYEAQSRDEMLRLVRRRMLSKIYIQLSEYIRLLTFILVCMFFTMILILFFLAIEL
jgi:hypothetical protein